MADLPDLVIDQIFRLVTTKAAIRMSFMSKQWEAILSSLPMLDFDEGTGADHRFDGDHNFIQHKNFTGILKHYLSLCEKDRRAKRTTPLDKLRLRMTRYSSRDAGVVYRLLFSSMERSVKELDISLGGFITVKNYYYLCRANLINAKTLTSLNLEYVRMKNIDSLVEPMDYSISLRLLPSLRTMSLKNVHFDHHALIFLVWECPYIEHLSLVSCSFDFPELEFALVSPTLKSMEIKHCKASKAKLIVKDLEILTVVSSELTAVVLERCMELKHVNIYSEGMERFSLQGECHDVNVIIDAPALAFIGYTGHLDSKFSLNAPTLYSSYIAPLNEESRLVTGPWKHFAKLKDCLQQFSSCTQMILSVDSFEDLIFPQDFRKTMASPILPNLEFLEVEIIQNPPTYERDKQDLKDSLYWMAPALKVEPSYI